MLPEKDGLQSIDHSSERRKSRSMSKDRLAGIADRLLAARRQGSRIPLAGSDAPADYEEGFAIQDMVVAALGSPVIGWKVMPVPQGPVIFAPILQSGRVTAGGTWTVEGRQPAGIELEIAFRLGRDLPPGATSEQVLDAVESAHAVFELCQSRLAEPAKQLRHVMLADCIANAGLVVGSEIRGWRSQNLKQRAGRLLVDGKVHIEGKSVDPIAALQMLPPALVARGKPLAAGQIVITGSLIGMNWLTGRHDLEGIIDGLGKVALELVAA
jgi:2-keto-4-pentenoate hydratase